LKKHKSKSSSFSGYIGKKNPPLEIYQKQRGIGKKTISYFVGAGIVAGAGAAGVAAAGAAGAAGASAGAVFASAAGAGAAAGVAAGAGIVAGAGAAGTTASLAGAAGAAASLVGSTCTLLSSFLSQATKATPKMPRPRRNKFLVMVSSKIKKSFNCFSL
jgi:hypothetical protein